MTSIYFEILNSAKLPLSVTRGNEKMRFQKSRDLSKQLLTELNKTDNYSDEFILNTIAKVLAPHNINVTIEENKLKTRGGHRAKLEILNANNEKIETAITGHVLCLNPDPKKRDKYTIVHEAGHIFDTAFNPKGMRSDYIKLFNKDKIYDTVRLLKDKFCFITNMKELRELCDKSMTELPDEYAIDALQNIRYRLKTEINQYKFGLQAMLRDKNVSFENLINELFLYFSLKFKSKLKLANKLLEKKALSLRKN